MLLSQFGAKVVHAPNRFQCSDSIGQRERVEVGGKGSGGQMLAASEFYVLAVEYLVIERDDAPGVGAIFAG